MLTPGWIIGILAGLAVILFPIGIFFKNESDKVVEYVVGYDGAGVNKGDAIIENGENCMLHEGEENSFSMKHSCLVHFRVKKNMKAPIFVYYQLDDFYQNHRRYVQSKNDLQLMGKYDPLNMTCDDSPARVSQKFDIDVPTGQVAERTPFPCGLIANSLFNGEAN